MQWSSIDGKLTKEFSFKNFKQAVDFVDKVAIVSEEANHHPDITIHSYNKVKLQLVSHDEQKITEKDIALSKSIDTIYKY